MYKSKFISDSALTKNWYSLGVGTAPLLKVIAGSGPFPKPPKVFTS